MIVEFEKKYLEELYAQGKSSDKKHRFQPQVVNGYLKCVRVLMTASRMEDLFTFRSLRYEKLIGDKKGLSSLRINDQYRLEFREIADTENSSHIVICSLVDITNHYK
ncbi:MAG: type II toxin-antitoxin system RelE/ParE family toxin [Bacteroidales bacterium]|nr:type II toxin-antitoxin system RelE/ParE family toxin [Bacteroidales bacterium]